MQRHAFDAPMTGQSSWAASNGLAMVDKMSPGQIQQLHTSFMLLDGARFLWRTRKARLAPAVAPGRACARVTQQCHVQAMATEG
jgi:hypothetical protein